VKRVSASGPYRAPVLSCPKAENGKAFVSPTQTAMSEWPDRLARSRSTEQSELSLGSLRLTIAPPGAIPQVLSLEGRDHGGTGGAMSESVSFTDFYRAWWRFLLDQAGQRLDCPEDCEEVAQRVMIRLWRDGRWRTIESPAGYLRTAARRESYALLRSQGRRVRTELSTPLQRPRRPDEVLMWKEDVRRVAECIASLPPQCRAVCTLVFLGQRTHAEAAEQLAISQKAVAKQVARGRAHIRRQCARVQHEIQVSSFVDGGA
jgi:RNA polymerase sigma-70 factor (ECF subfamily)